MKKSIWTKQMDLSSKKIKKFLDDDERAKRKDENCEKRRKYRNI